MLLLLLPLGVFTSDIHEVLGAAAVLFMAAHLWQNRQWFKSLNKGKYNGRRRLWTAVNLLLLASMVLTAVTGMDLSWLLFPSVSLEMKGGAAWELHRFAARLCFLLLAVHIWFHYRVLKAKLSSLVGGRPAAALLVILLLVFADGGTAGLLEGAASSEPNYEAFYSKDDWEKGPALQEGSKALVVYYSLSGNTAKVAKEIAAGAGADLFAIEMKRPAVEGVTRDDIVSLQVPDWEKYDTVYLGYPIWSHFAAVPMQYFVEDNDFTGKRVVPFSTSSSTGAGQSAARLRHSAKGGKWLKGFSFFADTGRDEILAALRKE